jgi:putative ABC transport system permease protein
VTADYPTARLQDRAEYKRSQSAGADKELGLFGTALGLAIGMFFSWAMVKALPDQAALTVPVGQLVAGTIVAALAGVAAAILPARQAARLDSLAAISTE